MRAFLIDPTARSITALDYRGGDDATRALIGAANLDTRLIGTFGGAFVYAHVDDTALLKSNACFRFEGYLHPLAGKALLLGCDDKGRTVECPLSLEHVRSSVRWVVQGLALAQARANQVRGHSGLLNLVTPERA